jgi:Carboxypeptidase regulatory-like domain
MNLWLNAAMLLPRRLRVGFRSPRRTGFAIALLCSWAWCGSVLGSTAGPVLVPAEATRGPCVIRLVAQDLQTEQTASCGVPLRVPRGSWIAFIEVGEQVGTRAVSLAEGESSRPRTPLALATRIGGRVRLAPGVELGESQRVLLLSAAEDPSGPPGPVISRVLAPAAAAAGALLPAGPALALVWDQRKQYFLAAQGPFTVRAGEVVEIDPRAPESTTVVALLDRPLGGTMDQDGPSRLGDDLELFLAAGGQRHTPELLIHGTDRVIGLWSDPPGQEARVGADSAQVFLPETSVPLRPRQIEHVKASLRPLPSISVQLALPAALRKPGLALGVLAMPGWRELRELQLEPEAGSITVRHLPPSLLQLELRSAPWKLRQEVDLSDGEDAEVLIEPQLIEMSGTVYRGGQPTKARLGLYADLQKETELEVAVDDSGRYETVLFRPGTYIAEVLLEGSASGARIEIVEVPDQAAVEQDFHLPDLLVQVEVVDAESEEGIAGAEVGYASEDAETGELFSLISTTDSAGKLDLENLNEGPLQLTASAEGYLPSAPRDLIVGDGSTETVRIALDPEGTRLGFRIRLPSGDPASGAEGIVVSALTGGQALWSGVADPQGLLRVPSRLRGGMILVRHPAAASAWRLVPSEAVDADLWQLGPAAEPLRLHTTDAFGSEAPWSPLALSVDGQWISGDALAFAFQSRQTSDGNGYWQARGLPRRSIAALARLRDQQLGWTLPMLGQSARSIDFPWSADLIEVDALAR